MCHFSIFCIVVKLSLDQYEELWITNTFFCKTRYFLYFVTPTVDIRSNLWDFTVLQFPKPYLMAEFLSLNKAKVTIRKKWTSYSRTLRKSQPPDTTYIPLLICIVSIIFRIEKWPLWYIWKLYILRSVISARVVHFIGFFFSFQNMLTIST